MAKNPAVVKHKKKIKNNNIYEKVFNDMHTSFIHGIDPGKFSEMAQATTFKIIFS